eukprot:TRINITY_DN1638_c0_g1_i15.p1 TRINITY_DN1638_c0_g1~~TRINITY_DN1638_c0_g1_i15.p1  ORF type:complete len:834 (-),score=236.29 TRINITY_DN1638_c0_g1_i15:342-2843(-)
MNIVKRQLPMAHGSGAVAISLLLCLSLCCGQPESIELSNSTIVEHNDVGQRIGTLSIVPASLQSTTTFSIDPAQSPSWRFQVQADQLLAAQSFDYNTERSRQPFVLVRATTSGWASPLVQQFNITIANRNLRPTDIVLDLTTSSNQPADIAKFDTALGTLRTVDPDQVEGGPPLSFVYALVSGAGDADNGALELDGNTLKTREWHFADASYHFRVRSTDEGGLWLEKQFVVTKGSDSSSIAIGFAVGVAAFLVLGLLLLLLLWLAKKRGWKLRCCCCCGDDKDDAADTLPLRSLPASSSSSASGRRALSSSRSHSKAAAASCEVLEMHDDGNDELMHSSKAAAGLAADAVPRADSDPDADGSMLLLPGQAEQPLPSQQHATHQLAAAALQLQRVYRRHRAAAALRTELASRAQLRRSQQQQQRQAAAAAAEKQRLEEEAMAAQRIAEEALAEERRLAAAEAELERVRLEQLQVQQQEQERQREAAAAERERLEAEQRRLAAEQPAAQPDEQQQAVADAEVALGSRWHGGGRADGPGELSSEADDNKVPDTDASSGNRSGHSRGSHKDLAGDSTNGDSQSSSAALEDRAGARTEHRRGNADSDDASRLDPTSRTGNQVIVAGSRTGSSYRRGGLADDDPDGDDAATAAVVGDGGQQAKDSAAALQRRRDVLLGLLAPADRLGKQQPHDGLTALGTFGSDGASYPARWGTLADNDINNGVATGVSVFRQSGAHIGRAQRRSARTGAPSDEPVGTAERNTRVPVSLSGGTDVRFRTGPAQRGLLRTEDPDLDSAAPNAVGFNANTINGAKDAKRLGPALFGKCPILFDFCFQTLLW